MLWQWVEFPPLLTDAARFFFQEGLWLSVPVAKLGSGWMMSKYSKVVIRMRMGLFLHIRPTIQNLRISRWEFQSRRHISWVFLEAGGFSRVGSPKYSTYHRSQEFGSSQFYSVANSWISTPPVLSVPPKRIQQRLDSLWMVAKSCTTWDGFINLLPGMFTTYYLVQDFATIHSSSSPVGRSLVMTLNPGASQCDGRGCQRQAEQLLQLVRFH